jgi:SulP family sulfate permease
MANIASASFGGLPATGAIARTATAIRAGGRTPVAGMAHAVFVLLIMMLFAPLASYIPLAALGAVLVVVAWNMAEIKNFSHLLSAPPGDGAVLLLTFLLTVFVDLTVAIETGMVLAAFLFMHRMANAVELDTHAELIREDVDDFVAPRPDALERRTLPPGTEVFRLDGPFFFGAAARFEEVLARSGERPKVIILRMSRVPLIDSTGVAALKKFIDSAKDRGTAVIVSGVRPDVDRTLRRMKLQLDAVPDFPAALNRAESLTGMRAP